MAITGKAAAEELLKALARVILGMITHVGRSATPDRRQRELPQAVDLVLDRLSRR